MDKPAKPRKFIAQGVTDFVPHKLSDETREQIRTTLRAKHIKPPDINALFSALGDAVARYHAGTNLRDNNKAAATRDNLRNALKAAETLQAQVRELDGVSKSLLGEAMRTVAYTETNAHTLAVHVDQITNSFRRALDAANQFPQRGQTPDWPRTWLAVDVANIIATHLGVEPTATESDQGIYEFALVIVLHEATGHEPGNVHRLALNGIRTRKKQRG